MTDLRADGQPSPSGRWTLADVMSLPESCRVEVLDGAPLVDPSPLPIHQRITRRLAEALESRLPYDLQLEVHIDVLLTEDPLNYLTPDVVIFGKGVPLTARPVPSSAVLLVVEVAPRRASLAYAEAGVPHFWRVETQESGALALTVCTFELSAGRYVQSGEHTGRLAMTAPIPVDIELSHLAG